MGKPVPSGSGLAALVQQMEDRKSQNGVSQQAIGHISIRILWSTGRIHNSKRMNMSLTPFKSETTLI